MSVCSRSVASFAFASWQSRNYIILYCVTTRPQYFWNLSFNSDVLTVASVSTSGATRTVLLSSCASSITPFLFLTFGFGFLTSWQFVQLLRGLIHCHLRSQNTHCFADRYRQMNQIVDTLWVVSTVFNMFFVLFLAAFHHAKSLRLVSVNLVSIFSITFSSFLSRLFDIELFNVFSSEFLCALHGMADCICVSNLFFLHLW